LQGGHQHAGQTPARHERYLVDGHLRGRRPHPGPEHRGRFAVHEKQLETHQELRLVIQLEDKTSIQSEAIVRWVKAASQKDGYTSGVAFTKVSGKDQKKIQKFLKVLDETFGL
jgi:hypothetical protein